MTEHLLKDISMSYSREGMECQSLWMICKIFLDGGIKRKKAWLCSVGYQAVFKGKVCGSQLTLFYIGLKEKAIRESIRIKN